MGTGRFEDRRNAYGSLQQDLRLSDCVTVHVKVDFRPEGRFRKQALLRASRNALYPQIDEPFLQ
jgi:hypothetical protein